MVWICWPTGRQGDGKGVVDPDASEIEAVMWLSCPENVEILWKYVESGSISCPGFPRCVGFPSVLAGHVSLSGNL